MFAIDVLSRIVHVLTAITLVGGSVFTCFVLMPSAKVLADEAHQKFAAAITGRWKRFVHFGVLLFLVTGFYNYFRAIPLHKGDGLYHALIGTKMLLAVGIFFLAAALVGRSEKLAAIRVNRGRWIKVLVLLAVIVVSISGFVKVRGVPAGAPAVVEAAVVEAAE
ncbi:hypothetical protein [Planctomycetes bacterium K23_9]|uniref:Copper resistance protein D n=1 Tax=Stieleria marina TaxID=1930275 RepID=A0A517NRQ0_9BACT|nr:hypothetical protein K239x_17530 [Planctomycetes bacterium K23_9]